MAKSKQSFANGDRVAFSAAFLRNTGQFTGHGPARRGTVTGQEPLPGTDRALIAIQWDDGVNSSVLCANLARVGSRAMNAD